MDNDMTKDQLSRTKEGDVIEHATTRQRFIVTGNYGGRVTAVSTADVTNPSEWEVVVTRSVDTAHLQST